MVISVTYPLTVVIALLWNLLHFPRGGTLKGVEALVSGIGWVSILQGHLASVDGLWICGMFPDIRDLRRELKEHLMMRKSSL